MSQRSVTASRTPLLEWIAAGVGLGLLVFLLGVIGYDAQQGRARLPPDIALKANSASRTGTGYIVTFTAYNRGSETAAALEVEGQLMDRDRTIETSTATIDYVAGSGSTEGGFFFVHNPADFTLQMRPLGFHAP